MKLIWYFFSLKQECESCLYLYCDDTSNNTENQILIIFENIIAKIVGTISDMKSNLDDLLKEKIQMESFYKK